MNINRKNVILSYQDELLNELYNANTLIKAAMTCCQEREFNSEYYGIPQNYVSYISNERNEYLSLLTLAFDRMQYVNTINMNIENELTTN